MPLSDFMIHQVVYWAPSLPVDNAGQVQFAAPVQLCGRWLEITETFLDKNGNTQVSRAKVRLLTDVIELGVLWKGKLSALTSRTDPFLNPDAWEIRKFQKVYNRSGDEALRIAML